jgi:hypothetical protein
MFQIPNIGTEFWSATVPLAMKEAQEISLIWRLGPGSLNTTVISQCFTAERKLTRKHRHYHLAISENENEDQARQFEVRRDYAT